jgi:hypothetical protein
MAQVFEPLLEANETPHFPHLFLAGITFPNFRIAAKAAYP